MADGFQNNVSHSEGQGYGLVLVAIFGDRAAADLIMTRTADNLAVRPDRLLAWRRNPASEPRVSDRNNASDGDLFHAWGLMLSAARDNRPDLPEGAGRIAADLIRRCTAPHPDGSARGPVPDWVQISAAGLAAPPAQFSQNAGFEAVRVALFQIWSGLAEGPAARASAAAAEAPGPAGGAVTAWSLPEGAVLKRSRHEGYAAVAALARCAASGGFGAQIPAFTEEQPYYPATLHLMALVARATTCPKCVPIGSPHFVFPCWRCC